MSSAGDRATHQAAHTTTNVHSRIKQRRRVAMIERKIAVLTFTLFAFAAPPALGQAAIQEPGAFAFYHPNEDVLNRGAPPSGATLIPTTGARNAYAAVKRGSQRADFNQRSASHQGRAGAGRSWCLHDYEMDSIDCSYSSRP